VVIQNKSDVAGVIVVIVSNFFSNDEKLVKIGVYLRKLSQN